MSPEDLNSRIKALYHIRHHDRETRLKMIQQQMASRNQLASVSFAEMIADLKRGMA